MSAPEGLKDWNLPCFSLGQSDLSDHSATKNVIKEIVLSNAGETYRTHELPVGFSYRYPSHKDRVKPSGSRAGRRKRSRSFGRKLI